MHARTHTIQLIANWNHIVLCGLAVLRYPCKTGEICLDRLQLWWMGLRLYTTMPLTSLLSHGTDGAFHSPITCTHTHTNFLSGDAVVICDVPRGQGGLMNSTPHAVPALSWGINLQIWRATKQKIKMWVWNVKQTKERVIEWSRE